MFFSFDAIAPSWRLSQESGARPACGIFDFSLETGREKGRFKTSRNSRVSPQTDRDQMRYFCLSEMTPSQFEGAIRFS